MIPGFPRDADLGRLAQLNTLAFGKVVDVHPEHNSVDIKMTQDGRRLTGVPVVGIGNSGNTGTVDLPVPDLTTGRDEKSKWDSDNTHERDIVAIVGFVNGAPICLGFIMPPVTHMTFTKENGGLERRIHRHASDQYDTIDGKGNFEWHHPSGTYIRVAESPDHEDFTGKDYDKKWKLQRNTATLPHIHVVVANGGEAKTDIHIDPQGNVTVQTKKDFTVNAEGAVTITAKKDVTVTSAQNVVVTAAEDATITAVNANVNAATINADASAAANVTAPIIKLAGQVIIE